jgi:peptidoglycan-associated lipoprotein
MSTHEELFMIRPSIVVALSSLLLAACAGVQTEAPIDDSSGAAKVSTAKPVTEVTRAPAVTTAKPATKPETPAGTTTPMAQPVVETRPLPAAAAQAAATPPAMTPVAKAATADVTTPGAHRDPASPLAQRVIYFEFDSAVIDGRFQPILDAHAAYLKANPGFKVILQGHADERGSREYNLALGQRRAESVRQAMALLGVADGQMEAVSLGEEKPAVEGHDESAWKMNRRTEIHYVGE